jgi:dihydroorotate dehydrogenase electron transfer subunit
MAHLIEKPRQIAQDHFLLKINTGTHTVKPGQFLNIKTSNLTSPLLRRPFSIFDHENGITSVVIRVIGEGTRILSNLEPGFIDIIGPLGNGFTLMTQKKILLAGGGVGNAPLYYLAKNLRKMNNHITCIYGARSKEFVYLADEFKTISDQFILTTDDGSIGKKGNVPDIARAIQSQEDYDIIYTCGPAPMMELVVLNSMDKKTPVEISVENYFGCGVGICYGCTIETTDGMKRACIDGPVFDGSIINWGTTL